MATSRIQLLVARPIYLAHSAFADLRADFKAAEFCPGRNGHFDGLAKDSETLEAYA